MRPDRHLILRSRHFDVLRTLAIQGVEVISTSDLLKRLQTPRETDHAAALLALKQLIEEGVFRRAEDMGDDLELPTEVRNDVLWLCDRQRALTPGMLNAVIGEVEERRLKLDQFIAARDVEFAINVLEQLRTSATDIASFCASNRRAVVASVLEVKSKQDQRTIRQRFFFVADLHDHFIEPMREIVDDRGPLDETLRRVLDTARSAEVTFQGDPQVAYEVERLEYRIASLLRQSREDFIASSKEVLPLYAQYRTDSLLAETAATCLERFHRDGPGCFDFKTKVPVSTFRVDGLFSLYEVESFLDTIGRQVRARRKPICLKELRGETRKIITDDEMFNRMRAALPVGDALEWLFSEYSDVAESDVLRAFSDIVMNPEVEKHLFAGAERTFEHGNVIYRHHPVEVVNVP